jgi:hypothetical protein
MKSVIKLRQSLEQCQRLYDSILDQKTRTSLKAHENDLQTQIAKAERESAAENPPMEDGAPNPEVKT